LIGAPRTMRSPAAIGLLMLAALLTGCGDNAVRPASAPPHRSTPSGSTSATERPSLPPLVNNAEQDGFPAAKDIPPNVAEVPDAVPVPEPRSEMGNPDSYDVYGDHYVVLKDGRGFKERGMASWYGKKFQGKRTSSGEPYDMFKMTAAHKTLPIPCYVRVTNLDTGKTAVVRVNDRGPFHSGRVIDVSYAAAVKLDILGRGSIPVEIVALDPNAPTPPTMVAAAPTAAPPRAAPVVKAPPPAAPPAPAPRPPPPMVAMAPPPVVTLPPPAAAAVPAPTPAPVLAAVPPRLALAPALAAPPAAITAAQAAAASRYLQAGLFADPVNAAGMRERLIAVGITNVQLKNDVRNGAGVSRVLIGPFGNDEALAAARKRLLDLQLQAVPVTE
jgi:rare lipoprotein A